MRTAGLPPRGLEGRRFSSVLLCYRLKFLFLQLQWSETALKKRVTRQTNNKTLLSEAALRYECPVEALSTRIKNRRWLQAG